MDSRLPDRDKMSRVICLDAIGTADNHTPISCQDQGTKNPAALRTNLWEVAPGPLLRGSGSVLGFRFAGIGIPGHSEYPDPDSPAIMSGKDL